MNEQEIKDILDRYRAGTASEADLAFLESWYASYTHPGDGQLKMQEMATIADRVWARLDGQPVQRKIFTLPRIAAAASLLLLLGLGFWKLQHPTREVAPPVAAVTDAAPGKNAATLVLANGQKIRLDDVQNGDIARQHGVTVSKAAKGQLVYVQHAGTGGDAAGYNTLETGRGEQYQLVLPDGTHVWLNAASSVKYPVAFTGTHRTVTLTGEAYFEIAPLAGAPFTVIASQQTVTVLGTHFNMNTYSDEPSAKTTLVQGKIKIADRFGHQEVLSPGEQAVVAGASLTVVTTDAEEAIAWKNGYFSFSESDISTVMRQVGRWYNVSVKFEGKMPEDRFSGIITRASHVSQVLKKLELTGKVHFSIQDNTIIVHN